MSRIFGAQENRFPSVHISDIVEDNDGYLWIATPNGLTRFDGIRFSTLQHLPGSEIGLPGNSISCLSASQSGGIYAGVINNGLAYVDSEGRVTAHGLVVDRQFPEIEAAPEVAIEVSDTNVWFLTTSRAFNVWNYIEGSQSHVLYDLDANPRYPTKVLDATADGKGGLFLACDQDGVWRTSVDNKSLLPLFYPFAHTQSKSVHAVSRFQDQLVVGGKGLVAFSTLQGDSIQYVDVSFDVGVEKALVRGIQRTADGQWLFLVENTGLVVAKPGESARILFSHAQMQAALGSAGTMQSFLVVSSGSVFIGMSTGLIELHRVAQGVHNVDFTAIESADFTGVLSTRGMLATSDSTMYVGSKQGLLEVRNNRAIATHMPTEFSSGPADVVNVICEVDSLLLLGTNAGVYEFDPKTRAYAAVKLPYLYTVGTWVIERLDDTRLLVGTLGEGAYILDRSTNEVLSFPSNIAGLEGQRLANTVVVSSQRIGDELWIGTDNGVHVYNVRSNKLDLTYHSSVMQQPIYPVWDIVPWQDMVVLGTAGGGLITLHQGKDGYIAKELASDGRGLPSNIVRCVEVDRQGRLWVSTDKGITIFDQQQQPRLTLLANRDLKVSEFNFKSSTTYGDYMLFGGHGGVVRMDPSKIMYPSEHVYTTLAEFQAYGTDTSLLYLSPASDTLDILHKYNSFSLSPSVLKATRPDIAHWYIQLHGVDKAPRINRNVDPTMYYANVSPGVYELEMTAFMQNGQQATMRRPLYVQVVPAFWQTLWFRYSIGTLAVLLIVSPLIVWLSASRKRQRLQERLVEMHLSALRSQMNPHFVYNVLNSIVGYIVRGKKEEAIDYISDFAALMRIVLENSRKRLISLESELAALQQYLDLEAQRHNHSFSFQIKCLKGLDPSMVKMPSMLIQPFVENAIKHGVASREDGVVGVEVSRKDAQTWQCIIEDNGIGIERSLAKKKVDTHTSRGLEINHERVSALRALYGEYFSIEISAVDTNTDTEYVGTRVLLTFPILTTGSTE